MKICTQNSIPRRIHGKYVIKQYVCLQNRTNKTNGTLARNKYIYRKRYYVVKYPQIIPNFREDDVHDVMFRLNITFFSLPLSYLISECKGKHFISYFT